jgi:MFS family permease
LVAAGLVAVILGLAAAAVVVRLVDGAATGWAVALPLVVAGLGSGLVIAPNQTLTLAEVPLERAGSAAAVVQMGQRVGTALGIAVVGAAFFARLAASDDWVTAFETGLVVSIVLVAVALAVALLDLRHPARQPHPARR